MSNQIFPRIRLIICVMLLNISILFGAARIGNVENSLISDQFTEDISEDINLESLWFDAVKLNSIELIELLLVGSKIDVNISDSNGNTALHIAASARYEDLLVLLLKNGADSSTENKNEEKAVDLARKSGNYEVAEKLDGKIKKERKSPIIEKLLNSELDIKSKNWEVDNIDKNVIIKDKKEEKKDNSAINRYRCDNEGCVYTTSFKSNLIVHKRKHTGEKPYICNADHCNYATSTKSNLVVHKRKHTGEKPYKCDSKGCDYTTSHKSNLNGHKKKHLREHVFLLNEK